jgi:iron complex outermembrane receptor protein
MLKSYLLLGVAGGALLASSAALADVVVTDQVETVVVLGEGQTRQVQTITAKDLQAFVPGSSPFKAIANLPGVNFQSADSFGAYEWSMRLTVRGFSQNQLGFTLDGVPLGNMTYGNDNGLHITRAISSENLGRVELAQGTGSLGTASSSNLGGAIQFYSKAPDDDFGVYTAATGGSYDTAHAFVRLETGDVGTGGKGYISYGLQYSNKWKGDGLQRQQIIDGKFVQPIGSQVTATVYANYSTRRENDYQDLYPQVIDKFSYDFDNQPNNWPLAVAMGNARLAKASPPVPYLTYYDSYYNAAGLRDDFLADLNINWSILDNLTLNTTAYAHNNKGEGVWFTPDQVTPNGSLGPNGKPIAAGAPLSVRTTEYNLNRYGFTSNLDWTIENHDVEAGVWYENNLFHHARRFYGLPLSGSDRPSLQFMTNPFLTNWEYRFNTTTLVFHLQDSWHVTEALKLDFGFKTQQVNVSAHGYPNTGAITGVIKSSSDFLPQVGANYRIDDENEVFADFAENQSAFIGDGAAGLFAVKNPSTQAKYQAAFDIVKDKVKPETSTTFEGGYRLHLDNLQASIAAYYVRFHNRLLAEQVAPGVAGLPATLTNVGSVTNKGIELAANWQFASSWSLFGSYSYNRSTYDEDTYNGLGILAAHVKGMTVVNSPDNLFKATLGYDDGSVFGAIDLSYTGERFVTYTNDLSVPDVTTVDVNLGYRFADDTFLDGLEAQLNVTNLFDTRYISTIGTNGYVDSDPTGTLSSQTMLAAAPTEVFFTLKKKF